jgi:hypothetical protein
MIDPVMLSSLNRFRNSLDARYEKYRYGEMMYSTNRGQQYHGATIDVTWNLLVEVLGPILVNRADENELKKNVLKHSLIGDEIEYLMRVL